MKLFLALAILLFAGQAAAQSVVAARAIPSRTTVSAGDLTLSDSAFPGALTRLEDAVGQETRVSIYPGRPVRASDLGPPAVVERNDLVRLRYSAGAMTIVTEGRALDRAGVGEIVRVMNLSSRAVVSGRVGSGGIVEVSQ